MNKSKAKKILLFIVIPVLLISIIIVIFHIIKGFTGSGRDSQMISFIVSSIETFGVVISLIIAICQLTDSKEIARATFITEINRSFVENKLYMKLYDAFQCCYDGTCKYSHCCTGDCQLKYPKSYVSNYLTFFETIYLLTQNNVISFDLIDDLFSYRFFLAVHHKFVQQTKLQVQPQNFKNIFILEKQWFEYRKKHGKNIDGVYSKNRLSLMKLPQGIKYKTLIR